MSYIRKGSVIYREINGKLKKKITCASIEEARETIDILRGPKGVKDSDGELKKEGENAVSNHSLN